MKAIIAILILNFITLQSFAAKVTLSFDDAPDKGDWYFSSNEITDKIIGALREKQSSPVVFYTNPDRGKVDNSLERLRKYGNAGHFLANHTADHIDFRTATLEQYTNSIRRADELLSPLPNYKKWFRSPYLREGATDKSKGQSLKKYLKEENYKIGYVTVEIYDWHVNSRVSRELRKGNKVDLDKLKQFYINIILESIRFYDELALKVIGRSPIHVILLHENDINALFLADLIEEIRRNGHEIVSADKAFEDPIADPKWDSYHFAQRRLRAIAELGGFSGKTEPNWRSTQYIDDRMKQAGLIK